MVLPPGNQWSVDSCITLRCKGVRVHIATMRICLHSPGSNTRQRGRFLHERSRIESLTEGKFESWNFALLALFLRIGGRGSRL